MRNRLALVVHDHEGKEIAVGARTVITTDITPLFAKAPVLHTWLRPSIRFKAERDAQLNQNHIWGFGSRSLATLQGLHLQEVSIRILMFTKLEGGRKRGLKPLKSRPRYPESPISTLVIGNVEETNFIVVSIGELDSDGGLIIFNNFFALESQWVAFEGQSK